MQQSPPPAPQTVPAPVTHAPPPTAAHGAGPASLLTDPRWQTWGVWVAVAVSVIGGTLWLGRLDGRLSALDTDKLIETRDAAVAAIKTARKEAEQVADAAVAEAMQARTADPAWLARLSAGVSAQPVPGTAATFTQVAQQAAAQGSGMIGAGAGARAR